MLSAEYNQNSPGMSETSSSPNGAAFITDTAPTDTLSINSSTPSNRGEIRRLDVMPVIFIAYCNSLEDNWYGPVHISSFVLRRSS